MNKSVIVHVAVEAGALAVLGALTALNGMSWADLGMYAPIVASGVSIATSAAHKYLDKYTK